MLLLSFTIIFRIFAQLRGHTHPYTYIVYLNIQIYIHTQIVVLEHSKNQIHMCTSICACVHLSTHNICVWCCVYNSICINIVFCVCECVVKCLQGQENFTSPLCSLDLIYHIIRIIKDLERLLSLCTYPKLFQGLFSKYFK